MSSKQYEWPDRPLFQAQVRRIDRAVRAIFRQFGWSSDMDLAKDCRQEAELLLWQARDRLRALPEADRQKYANEVIAHAIRRVLSREAGHREHDLSLEELRTASGLTVELAVQEAADFGAFIADTLLEGISREDLAAAMATLRREAPDDYQVLDLYYFRGLNDRQIGQRQRRSSEAVRKQRTRAIAALRRQLQRDS